MSDDDAVPLQPRRMPRPKRALREERKVVPATRQAADELYRPRTPTRGAVGGRLQRLNDHGLLELRPEPGPPITQQQAHEALLDAEWGPEPA